jgi:hypothetical protein
MTARDLRVEIVHGERPVDCIDVRADPDDIDSFYRAGRNWLGAKHWDQALWREFEATWPKGWGRGRVRLG